jgi:serine-type D-Ala-D-Ala carboxypeptidase/endopeptidase
VSQWTPTEAQLEDYVGSYPLMPDFALRIFAAGARLFVQGTNQRSLELAPVEKDVFIADSVAAEIDFKRDTSGKVVSLTFRQRGQVVQSERAVWMRGPHDVRSDGRRAQGRRHQFAAIRNARH